MSVLFLGIARGDEIRQWRDSDGKLHVKIVGGDEPVDPDAAGMPLLSTTELTPDEKFSTSASLRRRAIENGVKRSSAEIARLDREIAETEGKEFVVYTPPTARSPEEAQFLLDSQRNAFLAARRFEEERSDHLRKLRRERRGELLELRDLWKGFETLREEVRDRYGRAPGWWRDRIECEGCLSKADVEQVLARRKRSAESENKVADEENSQASADVNDPEDVPERDDEFGGDDDEADDEEDADAAAE